MTEIDVRPESGNGTVVRNRRDLVLPEVSAEFVAAYPGLDPALNLDATLAATLGPGVQLRLSDLTRIKVPVYDPSIPARLMAPTADSDEPVPTARLVGVPVGMTARRSWWESEVISFSPPDCASRDLVHGVGRYGPGSAENPTGLCDDCPMSAIGSANKGTPASACREQRLVFLLTDAEILPLMVVVPAGSLQNHKGVAVHFLKKGIQGQLRGKVGGVEVRGSAWSAVEVAIGLEQTKNQAGQTYNRYTFTVVRRLNPDEKAVVDAYAMYVDELIAAQATMLDALAADEARAAVGEDGPGFADDDPEDDSLADGVEMPAAAGKATRGK